MMKTTGNAAAVHVGAHWRCVHVHMTPFGKRCHACNQTFAVQHRAFLNTFVTLDPTWLQVTAHAASWKQLYFERNLEDALEQ
eukprot:353182-Chlamydomonas_euryale.AAC.47